MIVGVFEMNKLIRLALLLCILLVASCAEKKPCSSYFRFNIIEQSKNLWVCVVANKEYDVTGELIAKEKISTVGLSVIELHGSGNVRIEQLDLEIVLKDHGVFVNGLSMDGHSDAAVGRDGKLVMDGFIRDFDR